MNKLGQETSPYLLQHKNNPVDWYPWNEEALNLAQKLNKPIILSIGYSACHWCHVMEKECFEDNSVADLMNMEFINIKVDREERPDIDMIYMESIHMMGLQGGWPLNVFLLPNQKPFYGGTYFPKGKWIQLLESIANAFKNHYPELEKSANNFSEALNKELIGSDSEIFTTSFEKIWEKMRTGFDPKYGGLNKAPKFPMPSLGIFLESLPYQLNESKEIHHISDLQLKRMAMGGIFDQIEGGFARYSVDSEWFAPHFEKMLYDNGQLLHYYALAFKRTHSPLYLEVIKQTIDFLEKSLKAPNGLFYSALDADSDGEEGKYYTINFEELNDVLPYENNIEFYDAYSLKLEGNWEGNRNIFYKTHEFLNKSFEKHLNIILGLRRKSISPGLDNKMLSSWNSMVCIGMIQVDSILIKETIHPKVLALYSSIKKELIKGSVILHQYSNSEKIIEGFLDDYAWWAYVNLEMYLKYDDYEYLKQFDFWIGQIISKFKPQNSNSPYFLYSNLHSNKLIANQRELVDSVIPSSNSLLCHLLFWHGTLLEKPDSTLSAFKMIQAIEDDLKKNPSYFSNWLRVASDWLWYPKVIIKYNSELYSKKQLLKEEWPIDETQIIFTGTKNLKDYSFQVCLGNQCLNLTKSIQELRKQLNNFI
jgi:uncharacterized protein YyaL (SSP411 family)